MTECSFYNGIRYQKVKTQQSICSNWQVVCKDANCVANVKTKTQLKLICQIFNVGYKIQQNFTISMMSKRFKLHQVFGGVARTFSYTKSWVLEGGHKIENFSKSLLS